MIIATETQEGTSRVWDKPIKARKEKKETQEQNIRLTLTIILLQLKVQ